MRRLILIAALLIAGCAEQAPPPSSAPAAALPAPVPQGTPEQRAARGLQNEMNQTGRIGAMQPSGGPNLAPFDIGGAGQGPVMPGQVSPAFRDF